MLYKKKIKILRIIPSLNPKYGGPSQATIYSSNILQKKGIKVDILTCDNKKEVFFRSSKIKIINKGPSLLGTYWFSLKLFFWLKRNKKKYDAFIVHGIWHFNTLMARLLIKKKYYVFLHGQLDPFFKNDFIKLIKKKIYWFLFEKNNLLNAKSILLTSKGEMQTLKNTFVNTDKIIKNIVGYGIVKSKFNKKKAINIFYKKFPNFKNKKFLLFLGRFHEKKGCDILIKALNKLSKKNIKINVFLAGPDVKFKNKLQILSKNYGLENNVFWSDIIVGDLKWGAISASSGMVLASHGENFGVSLAESLSCSKPVLTTYKVNIYKEILKYKAGLVSKNKVNDFAKILEEFNNSNKSILKQFSKNSYNCFNQNFNLDSKNNGLVKFLKNQKNNFN